MSGGRVGDGRSGTGALRTEVVTDLPRLAELTAAWEELLFSSARATAFVSPAWILTWYRHFAPHGVYAVAIWSADVLVGLAPFADIRLGRRPSFRLLVSAGTEHGDYGEPLLGPDPEPVAAAIVDHLCELVRRSNATVNLRRFNGGGPTEVALSERDDVSRAPMGQVAHNLLVRFDTVDDPEAHLQRLAAKHSVPRRLRRLCEAHPTLTFRPENKDVDRLLDEMRGMFARRWGAEDGPRLFAGPKREAFTREVVPALVESGFAQVGSLEADDRIFAVTNVLRVGSRYISDSAAYDPDPELRKYGLGQAELYESLRCCLAAGATEVDLRAGDFPYKTRWANDERITRSVVLAPPGARGKVALAERRLAMSRRARQLAEKTERSS